MQSAEDILRVDFERGYGHLPADMVYQWATEQSELSEKWKREEIPGTSATDEGKVRKEKMLDLTRKTLEEKSNFDADETAKRMAQLSERLEDPGLLLNFEFFRIWTSPWMLGFYFAVWDKRIADVMDYLHGWGRDLKGVISKVPEDDVWAIMSQYECMNNNERAKSTDVVDFIKSHKIKRATSFGGGNVPERFYDLPANLKLTVFDDGPVAELEELFPDAKQRKNVNYVHESLANAPAHKDLLGTQDLVWMHGVSMYLTSEEMIGAILCAVALLKPGGFMKFDYILMTESIRRVVQTQGWPYNPGKNMTIFPNMDMALAQAREVVSAVNARLGGKAYMDTVSVVATLVEPWGVQSLRITLQKHSD